MRRVLLVVALALALAPEARATLGSLAAEEQVRVLVRVTAASGRELFLDRGREAGLAPDDRVLLELAGAGPVEARVVALSRTSARAELALDAPEVPVGTRGSVMIPTERLHARESAPSEPEAATAEPSSPPAAPEHPGWTHPPEEWSSEKPLLAPAFGRSEAQRPLDVHGRAFLRASLNEDRLRDASWSELRAGVWLDAQNPFGRGGGLRFSAQGLRRESDFGSFGERSDSWAWIERLSYWEGGTVERPERIELGRFVQKEFPELGLLDGVEYSRLNARGDRFGASLGFLPEPYPGRESADDLAATLFYRAFLGADDRLALGGALQGTWHRGEQDRTLFLATLDWSHEDGTWLRSAAWIDLYGSDDGPKSSGLELTELQLQGGWRGGSLWGVSASFRRRRWPFLLRNELEPVSAAEIADARTEQAWLSGWVRLSSLFTLNARAGWWQDEQRDGTDVELGASLTEPWEGGRVDLAVLASEGAFSSVEPGLRASVGQAIGPSSASLAWTLSDYEQTGFLGEQATLLQQTLRAAFDWRFAPGWSATFGAQRLFGDELDAWIADFQLQRSF